MQIFLNVEQFYVFNFSILLLLLKKINGKLCKYIFNFKTLMYTKNLNLNLRIPVLLEPCQLISIFLKVQ